MNRVTRSVLRALIAPLIVAAAVLPALSSSVEDIREIPTASPQTGWHHYPAALLETAGPPPPVYVLSLRLNSPAALLTYPEIRLEFHTYGGRASLLDGTLEVAGTDCTYATRPGARLSDRRLLAFVRKATCDPRQSTPSGDVKLVVRLAARQRIGIAALVPVAPEQDAGPGRDSHHRVTERRDRPISRGGWAVRRAPRADLDATRRYARVHVADSAGRLALPERGTGVRLTVPRLPADAGPTLFRWRAEPVVRRTRVRQHRMHGCRNRLAVRRSRATDARARRIEPSAQLCHALQANRRSK